MNNDEKARLEEEGWVVGSATSFLELSPEEDRLIEVKLAANRGESEGGDGEDLQTA